MLGAGTTHLFTVADYHQMAEANILGEDDRVELIEGVIVDMSPIGRKHAVCVARFTAIFGNRLYGQALVWVQNPVWLGEHSEPQPDVTLLRWRDDYYADRDPTPEDVLLIIEVADSSLAYDRDVKVPLYARAGIPEHWLVDLIRRSVTVYRDPGPEGYRSVTTYQGSFRISPIAFPDVVLTDAEILG